MTKMLLQGNTISSGTLTALCKLGFLKNKKAGHWVRLAFAEEAQGRG